MLFYCVCPIVCIKLEYVFGKLGIMTGSIGINNNLRLYILIQKSENRWMYFFCYDLQQVERFTSILCIIKVFHFTFQMLNNENIFIIRDFFDIKINFSSTKHNNKIREKISSFPWKYIREKLEIQNIFRLDMHKKKLFYFHFSSSWYI